MDIALVTYCAVYQWVIIFTVIPVDSDVCRRSKSLKVTANQGYIASVTAQETWCGGSDTPWLIEALPGQRINITLLDFGVQRPEKLPQYSSSFDSIEVCQKYAVIKEQTRTTVVCGGRNRYHHEYLSNSNVLEIQIENRRSNPHYFLMKYEGKASYIPLRLLCHILSVI